MLEQRLNDDYEGSLLPPKKASRVWLTKEQKQAVIAYVKHAKAELDRIRAGGFEQQGTFCESNQYKALVRSLHGENTLL